MFVILPIGHDQPVYDRPWLTIGLIVACTGIFLGAWAIEWNAEQQMMGAANRIDAIHSRHPNARVSFTIDGLPSELDNLIRPLVDTDPSRRHVPGDQELEEAMLDLIGAMNRMPVLRFGYRPAHPTVMGAIGHAFMHGGLFHLLGNMLFLWVAGGVLECFWRRWAYALLYGAAAAAGLLAHHLSAPHSTAPMVGASGAIAGLIGAFVISYPRSRIRLGYFFLLLFKPVYGSWYVPAWIVIPLWGLSELLHALFAAGDGVAYWAHVGGFACGLVAGVVGRLMGWIAVDAGYERGASPVANAPVPRLEPSEPPRRLPHDRGAP